MKPKSSSAINSCDKNTINHFIAASLVSLAYFKLHARDGELKSSFIPQCQDKN